MKIKWIALIVLILIPVYVVSYLLNSAFGGYGKNPEMDGRDRYAGGMSMATAIKWKPVYGDWLVHDGDGWGYFYYPLLVWDRTHWHKTHYVTDRDFFVWANGVPKERWK